MSPTLNFIQKNGWRHLFFTNKNNILVVVVVIIFLTQNSAVINGLSEDAAPEIDVLIPLKPIKEYVKFASYFKSLPEIPDYKFQINNISQLIQQQSELLGREFPLPAFNCSAQIKCKVSYDDFQLSIRFLDPPNEGRYFKFEEFPVITIFIANNNGNPETFNENLRFVFSANSELVYGTFYPISHISYDAKIKNKIFYDKQNFPYITRIMINYLAVHLYLQQGSSEYSFVEDGVFFWKVDVSRRIAWRPYGHQHEYQLAMSPFVFKEHSGCRVQLRLFFKGFNCYVEVRFFNYAKSGREFLRMKLTVVHPTDSTKQIILPFSDYTESDNSKSSKILELTTIEELNYFFTDSYLLLAVEMQ